MYDLAVLMNCMPRDHFSAEMIELNAGLIVIATITQLMAMIGPFQSTNLS